MKKMPAAAASMPRGCFRASLGAQKQPCASARERAPRFGCESGASSITSLVRVASEADRRPGRVVCSRSTSASSERSLARRTPRCNAIPSTRRSSKRVPRWRRASHERLAYLSGGRAPRARPSPARRWDSSPIPMRQGESPDRSHRRAHHRQGRQCRSVPTDRGASPSRLVPRGRRH